MEKEINREMIFDGNIMQVTKEEVELEDGKHAFREVVYHHGGVCILAIENNQILLVKQFRYPNRIETLEIPAGKLEKDEDTKACAFRNLKKKQIVVHLTCNLFLKFYHLLAIPVNGSIFIKQSIFMKLMILLHVMMMNLLISSKWTLMKHIKKF